MTIQYLPKWAGIYWILMLISNMAVADDQAAVKSSLKYDDEDLMEIRAVEAASDSSTKDCDELSPTDPDRLRKLDEANVNLRKNVLEFKKKIGTLERSLSSLEDKYKSLREDRHLLEEGGVFAQDVVYVLDANDELQMVVLAAGYDVGLRPGLIYRVVRNGRVIARLRVLIVKRFVAAAKVLGEGQEEFPWPGDKAVLGVTRKRRD